MKKGKTYFTSLYVVNLLLVLIDIVNEVNSYLIYEISQTTSANYLKKRDFSLFFYFLSFVYFFVLFLFSFLFFVAIECV